MNDKTVPEHGGQELLELMKNADNEHSRMVSKISGMMAKKAGYSESRSRIIEQAGFYHDVGKSEIPPCILDKPSALTTDEFETVKTHTTIGCSKLNEAACIFTLASVVANQHHERVDGHGYPHELNGNEILPYSKLIACADVFDALMRKRPYKESWDISKIRNYFTEQSGKQFDPVMVEILFSIIDDVLKLYEN